MSADLEFFFDPVCPFCWVASRWVKEVQDVRGLDVVWRFISLRLLNDDDTYVDKPDLYPPSHQRGLEMLRVAAAVREKEGPEHIGDLYTAMGEAIWEDDPSGTDFDDVLVDVAEGRALFPILEGVGLATEYAAEAFNPAWDDVLRAERDDALERAGGDVGTPILSFDPPDGPAFFGPVISDAPSGEDAVELWEAVETLAHWPGFAELKRGLRDFPQTRMTARVDDDAAREAS